MGFRVLGALTCVALGDAEEIHVAFFAAFQNSPSRRKRMEKPRHLCQLLVPPASHASVPRLETALVLALVWGRAKAFLPHARQQRAETEGAQPRERWALEPSVGATRAQRSPTPTQDAGLLSSSASLAPHTANPRNTSVLLSPSMPSPTFCSSPHAPSPCCIRQQSPYPCCP